MSHEYVLWIATAAYGFHILEEYDLNWRLGPDALSLFISAGLGVVFMACPVILLKIRHWNVFRYGEPSEK